MCVCFFVFSWRGARTLHAPASTTLLRPSAAGSSSKSINDGLGIQSGSLVKRGEHETEQQYAPRAGGLTCWLAAAVYLVDPLLRVFDAPRTRSGWLKSIRRGGLKQIQMREKQKISPNYRIVNVECYVLLANFMSVGVPSIFHLLLQPLDSWPSNSAKTKRLYSNIVIVE